MACWENLSSLPRVSRGTPKPAESLRKTKEFAEATSERTAGFRFTALSVGSFGPGGRLGAMGMQIGNPQPRRILTENKRVCRSHVRTHCGLQVHRAECRLVWPRRTAGCNGNADRKPPTPPNPYGKQKSLPKPRPNALRASGSPR